MIGNVVRRLFGVTEEMSRQVTSLTSPVRVGVLAGYLGRFLLILAALCVPPTLVAAGAGEPVMARRFAVVVGVLSVVGWWSTRRGPDVPLQRNESLVLSALVFLATPLVMTYPMTAPGLAPVDAFFEAVSGVTTTGLSTLASVEEMPDAFLFNRAWMQWYGGLGFVLISLALVVDPGSPARRLADAEEVADDLIGSTRAHARWVLGVYAFLTVAGIAVVWALGTLGVFDAVLYVFSAVSTGGFSPHDASLGGLPDRRTPLLITLVSLAGAVSFVTYRRLYREGWRTAVRDRQAQMLLTLCGVAVLGLFLVPGAPVGDRLWRAAMTGISAQTTTGFTVEPVGGIAHAGTLLVMVAMFVGGCVGSTAGGIKVRRLTISLRLTAFMVVRSALPRDAVVHLRAGERRLSEDDVRGAVAVVFLFLGTVVVSWLVFLVAGHDPMASLFEVVSATGTVGLSTGVTAPELSTPLKAVLCMDMLMGRLEILAWIVFLYPRTWLGKRRPAPSGAG